MTSPGEGFTTFASLWPRQHSHHPLGEKKNQLCRYVYFCSSSPKSLPYEATAFIRDPPHTSTQRLVCKKKKKKVPVFMSFKLREAC